MSTTISHTILPTNTSPVMLVPSNSSGGMEAGVPGGFWPVYTLPSVIVYSAFLLPLIVMGISSHVFLLAVMCRDRQFHTIPYAIITSLAVSDFTLMLFAPPFMLDNVLTLYDSGLQGRHSVTGTASCTAMGFIIDVMVTAVGFNMVLLAVNREVCIVHPKMYSRVFSKTSTGVYICIVWCLSLALIIPTQMPAIGRIIYDPVYNVCKYDEQYNLFYSLVVNLRTFVVAPLLILAYGAILIKVRRSKRSVSGVSGGGSGTVKSEQQMAREKREMGLVIQFLVIVVVYVISWIFYMVLTILATQFNVFLGNAGLYVNNLIALNSSINPVVYFTFNRQMRRSAAALLRCGNTTGRATVSAASTSSTKSSGAVSSKSLL